MYGYISFLIETFATSLLVKMDYSCYNEIEKGDAKVIYLDYSATTKPLDSVVDTFVSVTQNFPGNPNSLHRLGVEARELIETSTKQVKDLLQIQDFEVIYTSGASESNNLAIKGICEKYANRGKHIITTKYEHSSIYGPIGYLGKNGFTVDFVETDQNGIIDINHFKNLLRDDTLLVTISAVNSEIGLRQPIEEIADILKEYPKCFFHVDATQCIGKGRIDIQNVDLVSFTAHKFYGLKGIGVLLKKESISLEPSIHGGKSTTKYRSGTPSCALIASFAKALRLALENIDSKYEKVESLNKKIREKLEKYDGVSINHNDSCLPHMLNISIEGVKPETFQHALEEYDIFISTQSACSSGSTLSQAVLAMTKDEKRANSSIRISLSSFTTEKEVDTFLESFDACYQKLHF